VFHTTHTRVFISVAEPRTINLPFSAHSSAFPSTLDRRCLHSHFLTRPPRNLLHHYIQPIAPIPPSYHPFVMTFLSNVLSPLLLRTHYILDLLQTYFRCPSCAHFSPIALHSRVFLSSLHLRLYNVLLFIAMQSTANRRKKVQTTPQKPCSQLTLLSSRCSSLHLCTPPRYPSHQYS